MPKIFPEDIIRDGGQGQKNVGSLIDTLVNTVSHMERDLAILRDENRALRTPATSQVIQAPQRAALTTTKVPRFDGSTSWEQYQQCLRQLYGQKAGTMIQQHYSCSRIWREMR